MALCILDAEAQDSRGSSRSQPSQVHASEYRLICRSVYGSAVRESEGKARGPAGPRAG